MNKPNIDDVDSKSGVVYFVILLILIGLIGILILSQQKEKEVQRPYGLILSPKKGPKSIYNY